MATGAGSPRRFCWPVEVTFVANIGARHGEEFVMASGALALGQGDVLPVIERH
jgi:hypothetical protein